MAEAARNDGLRLLVAFGSSLKEGSHPNDLDLALLPAGGWTEAPDDGLWGRWTTALGRGDLDLIWLPSANWQLCRQVALHGEVVYESRPGLWRDVQVSLGLRAAASDGWRAREKEYLTRLLEGTTGMDRDLVRRKATLFGQYLRDLEQIMAASQADFDHRGLHYAAERLIELLVEQAGWINTEVSQSIAGIPPSDYYSSFFSMSRAGWLELPTAQALAELARLRNALVHHYEDVPLDTLHSRITLSLPHWRTYLTSVTSRL